MVHQAQYGKTGPPRPVGAILPGPEPPYMDRLEIAAGGPRGQAIGIPNYERGLERIILELRLQAKTPNLKFEAKPLRKVLTSFPRIKDMAQLKQIIHELAEDDREWEEWDQKKTLYNIKVSLGTPPTSPLHQPEVSEPPETVPIPVAPAAAAPVPPT